MRIDIVYAYSGSVPERFQGEGPFEVTMGDLVALASDRDVAIMHFAQEQPTYREQKAGAPLVPDRIGLGLDSKYGRFRQR